MAETGRARSGWASRLNPFAEPRTRAEWVVDAVHFAVAFLAWLTYVLGGRALSVAEWFWPLDLALGFCACVALWWLRRYPAAVGALLIVPGTFAYTAAVGVLLGVYRMATLAPPRRTLAIAAAHILLALPYHFYAPISGITWLGYVVIVPLLYVIATTSGLLVRSRRQVVEGLRTQARLDRERYESELASIRRDERERIAREMHDVLAHRISLLSVHAGALEFRSEASATMGDRAMTAGEIHEAAVIIRQNAHLAVEDLRGVLSLLRDDNAVASELGSGPPAPRLADLPLLVREASHAGQHVDLVWNPKLADGVRDSVQRTAYRVVQEGLTNARKHAPRARVSVDIAVTDASVNVSVRNAVALGITTAEIPGARAGLAGLAERARLEGGVLRHELRQGEFVLECDIPREARR